MKLGKIVAVLLACIFALGLLACKKTDDPVIDIGGSASPNQTDAPATQQGSVADSATPNSGLSTSVPTSEGTSDINPTPTEAPDNESIVSLGSETAPARNTMPTETYGLSNAECESWFSDAVFIGDSITIGWKNYNNRMLEKNPEFFGNTRFLCEGSYGVRHALEPISDSSLHPVYGGEQCYIWDAVKKMGAKKVFILFGLNDISIWGVQGTADNYAEVISNIRRESPETEIYVISAMYMFKGSEREKLNNKNIYALNKLLAEMCRENGYEFVNIASNLIDEGGFLPKEYCSDNYVHQTYSAYAVWADVLRSLAARHITGQGKLVFE